MNNPGRRATPDSEAVGSSEDERPWPSSTTFGQLRMRENSYSGLPGGIWAQKRGSFKMSDPAKREALHGVRLSAGNPAPNVLRSGNTDSPSSDRAGNLPFSIPIQPVSKAGRSLSHSQGQRELPISTSAHTMSATGSTLNNPALPLGLLTEEADTDSESEAGTRLTHTTSHPPIGTLTRTTTLPAAFDGSHSLHRSRDLTDSTSPSQGGRLEASFANLAFDNHPRRTQWQSSLGWDDVRVNESRRHSMADIPTRRGSLVGGESGILNRTFSDEVFEPDESHHSMTAPHRFSSDRSMNPQPEHPGVTFPQNGHTSFEIPPNYRVPQVNLNEREQSEINSLHDHQSTPSMQHWLGPGGNRPRKQLYIVSFKCSRVDVFYLLENTGLTVREGNLVIVEADRGQDLGTVQHANVTPDEARAYKKKYSEEQYKWLMMYSQNKEGASNPNAEPQRESSERPFYAGDGSLVHPGHPNFSRDSIANLKPKAIKRLAQDHEVKMLADKEGNEAKAKRTCQQKVAHLRLQMEILDAEWQWDFQKLIFYYYADHYINFKDLITELYRIYKTRIWLSAINPASFSQHANQPPSGIGPGAVTPFNPYGLNNAYTMAYGEDRDPYGAQMPYRIGYETYTPNFPAIPGVPNSFAPGTNPPYLMGYYPGAGAAGGAGNPNHSQIPGNYNSANNPAVLAQRQMHELNVLYNTAGLNQDNSHAASPFAPHGGQQSDNSRPNYSFGPRTSNMNARGSGWDGMNRTGATHRGPGIPNPIGTRSAPYAEELHRGVTHASPGAIPKLSHRLGDTQSNLSGSHLDVAGP